MMILTKEDKLRLGLTIDEIDDVTLVKKLLSTLTDEQRLEVMGDYCYYCGRVQPRFGCHCNNDE